jgi:hypothetical protein
MIAMRRWFGLLLPTLALGCTPDTFETGDATQGDGAVSDSATDVTCDGPLFCVAKDASFCSDFDENSIPYGWDSFADFNNGYLNAIATDTYVSCPHSVRMIVPTPDAAMNQADGSVNAGHAWIIKDLMTMSISPVVTLDVAARVPGNETADMGFTLFEVRDGMGDGSPYVGISYYTGTSNPGWQLHVYNNDIPIPSGSIPSDTWLSFSLTVTFSSAITADLTINGGSPIVGASTGTISPFSGTVELALGIASLSFAPPGFFDYDNVLIQVQ